MVQASSDDLDVRVLRARVQLQDQQYAAAARTLERATQGSDNRYDGKYWLALAERGQGQVTQAGATLDQLLAGQPNHQLGLEAKVRLVSDQKDWQAALAAQARLSALRPGLCRCTMSAGRPFSALEESR